MNFTGLIPDHFIDNIIAEPPEEALSILIAELKYKFATMTDAEIEKESAVIMYPTIEVLL